MLNLYLSLDALQNTKQKKINAVCKDLCDSIDRCGNWCVAKEQGVGGKETVDGRAASCNEERSITNSRRERERKKSCDRESCHRSLFNLLRRFFFSPFLKKSTLILFDYLALCRSRCYSGSSAPHHSSRCLVSSLFRRFSLSLCHLCFSTRRAWTRKIQTSKEERSTHHDRIKRAAATGVSEEHRQASQVRKSNKKNCVGGQKEGNRRRVNEHREIEECVRETSEVRRQKKL